MIDTSGLTSDQARLAVLWAIAEREAAFAAAESRRLTELATAAVERERRLARTRDDARIALERAVPDWRSRLMETEAPSR